MLVRGGKQCRAAQDSARRSMATSGRGSDVVGYNVQIAVEANHHRPRLCENSTSRRARRNILEKLRVMRTDNAADIRLDDMLEDRIFYISPMSDFSHSLGPKRRILRCNRMSAVE